METVHVVVDPIGFTSGGWRASDLVGALAVYAGPADLLAKYDDSPLARRPGLDG